MPDNRATTIEPLIPIMIIVMMVFGVFIAFALSNREPPRCTNYSYINFPQISFLCKKAR